MDKPGKGQELKQDGETILSGAGLNDGLVSETMDFRDFPSVLSVVRIAQS